MAHKEAQDTFNRHYPFWKQLGGDILVVHPTDSKVILPEREKIMAMEFGKAAHTGVQSIVRFRSILEHMNGLGYDRSAFFEYDSFCLGEFPEMKGAMMAPVFRDNSPERGFEGTTFCHPPLFFTPFGLSAVTEVIKTMPLTAEGSVWDRFLGLAIERANLEPFDLLGAGMAFCDNTIHPARHPALALAVRNGSRMFHGVKDEATLKVILEANRLREAAEMVRKNGGEVTWKD